MLRAMTRADHGRSPPHLRVATHLAPSVLPAYALAARRMGERLGRPAELVVAADYGRCAADIDHICFVCSIPYLLLSAEGRIRMEAIAAPILRGRRYGGRPVYFSDVIVRADRRWRSLEDLDGRRWAFNEPYSHSGFIVVLHALARLGATIGFVRDAVEAGFHDDAIRLVVDGRADWAAIDTQVLDLALRQQPRLRQELRVIDTLGPSTIQPVVASARRLSAARRAAAREALLAMDAEPSDRGVLRAAGIERFVAVTDADYDDVRSMLATVERAGLLPAWWWPRWRELTAARLTATAEVGATSAQAARSVGFARIGA
jgi:phosphonate transport system substrate-binding protein